MQDAEQELSDFEVWRFHVQHRLRRINWRGLGVQLIHIMVFLLGMLLAPTAMAGGFTAALGGGFASAGVVPGGFTLSPSAGYAWHTGELTAVKLTNEANVTGLDYANIGLVNNLLISWGYSSPGWTLDFGGGPSAMSTILCGTRFGRRWEESTFCNRVTGVALAAKAQVAYFHSKSPMGAFLSAGGNWVPAGAVYAGPLLQVTIGSVIRFGDKRP